MIKRFAVVLLLMMYACTSFGFTLNLHYCYGTLTDIKIDAPAKTCKLPVKKMKCCADKHVDVKVKDAHQGESPSFFAKVFGFDIPQIPFSDYALSAQQALLEKLSDQAPPAPPPSGKTSHFIKNCSLRL